MKLHIKTILAILLSLTAILSLCACDTEIKSEGAQVQSGQHSAVAGLSSTEPKQDLATSEKTVSVAVDTVPFDEFDHSTWLFPERTDLISAEDATKIQKEMLWSDLVAMLGKPQSEFYVYWELGPGGYTDVDGGNKNVPIAWMPVYKLSDGNELAVKVQIKMDEEERHYRVVGFEIGNSAIEMRMAWLRENWYVKDGSVCPSVEELESTKGLTDMQMVEKLGRPWALAPGGAYGLVYKLSNGKYGRVYFTSLKDGDERDCYLGVVNTFSYFDQDYADGIIGYDSFAQSRVAEMCFGSSQ